MLDFLHYLLSFVFIISVIVFVHEFGHYFVAKMCGVKVEAFSIGMGKEIFGVTDRSGTRWKFSILPIGGYVRMYGDATEASTPSNDLDNMTEEQKRLTFHHKPLWQKTLIVAAGPVANFVLTITILTCLIMTTGISSTEPVVGSVMLDSPAYAAGLLAGDKILKVNDDAVTTFNNIPALIATNLGTPVILTLERQGKQITQEITPKTYIDDDGLGNKIERPIIGIRSQKMKYEEANIGQAVIEATKRTYVFCTTSLEAIGQIVTGQRSVDQLKGPLGIAKLSGQATDKSFEENSFYILWWFIALLSANLGMVNLFPIPMLDGGHLTYYAAEAIRGRPLAEKVQAIGYRVGLIFLGTLMLFTLFNDVRKMLL